MVVGSGVSLAEHDVATLHDDVVDEPLEAATRRRVRNPLAWVVIVVASVSAFVVGVVARVAAPGSGSLRGDQALIGLAVRSVGDHAVLLGPYSRFGWRHPGPLLLYLLAVPDRLLGDRTSSLVIGVALINLAAAIGVIIVCVRRSGPWLGAWAAIVVGVSAAALGPALFEVWNPDAVVLPFTAVVVLAWALACRDVWALPWLVVAATFCIQTHVGLAPGALAACVAGIVMFRVHGRRIQVDPAERTRLRRAFVVAAVLGFVLWLPPLIEQLTAAPGNLALLTRFFADHGPQHSLVDGVRTTASQVAMQVWEVVGGTSAWEDVAVGVAVVAFASAVVMTVRTRSVEVAVLLGIVALELVVAVSSVTRIVGPIESYLVQWISSVGLVMWIAVGAAVIELVRRSTRSRPRWQTVGTGVLLLAIALATAVSASAAALPPAGSYSEPSQERIVDAVARRAGDRRDVVLALGDGTTWVPLAGAALELERRGFDVHVVRSRVAELFFAPYDLVARRPGQTVFSFRDARRSEPGAREVVVTAERWFVVLERPS